MADEPLLSDLCTICNRNPPKYRCPRDAVRTCSLPCYKRHQQWAQCDGKRDPAAYVKRSQLATPAGIDHDYNFLTSIERGLQRAEETASPGGQPSRRHAGTHARLQQYLQSNRIIVDRAPVGMSRQKSNNTRVTKGGRIFWTVEWLHEDGSRELRDADADTSLADLFAALLSEHSRKRKRTEQEHEVNHRSAKQGKDEHSSLQSQNGGQSVSSEGTQEHPTAAGSSAEEQKEEQSSSQQLPSADITADAEGKHNDNNVQSFYLLKPHTPSSQPRVLIPLDASSTLTAALASQVVLEYPTIKVLPRQASDGPLPDGFMLEEEYIRQTKQDVQELEALIGPHGEVMTAAPARRSEKAAEGQPGKAANAAGEDGPVDDRKLLEVLTRDLNARK